MGTPKGPQKSKKTKGGANSGEDRRHFHTATLVPPPQLRFATQGDRLWPACCDTVSLQLNPKWVSILGEFLAGLNGAEGTPTRNLGVPDIQTHPGKSYVHLNLLVQKLAPYKAPMNKPKQPPTIAPNKKTHFCRESE